MPLPPWLNPIHIGRGVLEREAETRLPDRNQEIVCVCAGGMRSVKTADTLQKLGYKKVGPCLPSSRSCMPSKPSKPYISCLLAMRLTQHFRQVHSLKTGASSLCAGHPLAYPGVRNGFQEAVGNTPLIRLNRLR
eukprot:1205347-Rhodomonas_salina.2